MTNELKPVPCGCGREAKVVKHTFHGASPSYGVECTNCHAESWQFYSTEAEAITAWNRAMGADKRIFIPDGYVREKIGSKNHE